MRVLYVDDDRVNAMLFAEVCRLGDNGIEVQSADCGADALALAAAFAPELMVIDLHLPDGTGYDLLPRLRALPGLAGVPAVLCTADDLAEVQMPARAAGFDTCWEKPIDPQALLREIHRVTQR
jgi:two-component system, OmpR family, response regulator